MDMRGKVLEEMARGAYARFCAALGKHDDVQQMPWTSVDPNDLKFSLDVAGYHLDALLASTELSTLAWLKLENSQVKEVKPLPAKATETLKAETPSGRGSGRTSEQLRQAPQGAFFICAPSASRTYMRNLARHLLRDDIQMILPSEFGRLTGANRKLFVVDHSAWEYMTAEQVIYWNRITRDFS